MKLNILTGMVNLDGKAKYLDTVNKSEEVDRTTLVLKLKTKCDTLLISHAGILSLINPAAFKHPDTTHVVTQIYWGANVSATFDQQTTTSTEKNTASGSGSATTPKIKELVSDLSCSSDFQRLKEEESKGKTIKIEFQGDVEMNIMPSSMDDALAMIKNIPLKIAEKNGGKGVQISYILTPLSEVIHYLPSIEPQVSPTDNVFARKMDDDFVRHIQIIFDQLLLDTRRMNAFIELANNKYKNYLSAQDATLLQDQQVRCTIF
ncbi:unnamed protein product [Didymodactylos carnosus]|uniref:Uncharacterized protein n=1 Tax=Didymodactylos carnosus TaxID=1234261 RepID=A0A813P959_9BILA|nr:unnamed protein product [Didymodactylos carnosus]CAF0749397.1 unnamed protein product [Didymodactylos carnosus]CAF3493294.1 unnamed protein product [Didymodactylos carnosus]CAF3528724.1 unnamed protein product [Didymodactylos carnosus]